MTRSELWCRPGIFLVCVDEDIVILNLADDDYGCLIGAADRLRPQADGRIFTSGDSVARDLLEAGLASETPLADPRSPFIPPRREETGAHSISRTETVSAGSVLSLARLLFRRKSLPALLASPMKRRPSDLPLDAGGLGRLVGAVRAARPWVPFEGECLQRSFELRYLLARRAVPVDWVFGVRTWPFGAHCWLQSGEVVVGDRLDRIARYTPIMKV